MPVSSTTGLVGAEHRHRTRAVGVALEEALLLQHPQLVGDRRGAGQPDPLTDLAHAGRVAAVLDGVLDRGEHPLLAGGEPGGVRGAVGELGDSRRSGLGCLALACHGPCPSASRGCRPGLLELCVSLLFVGATVVVTTRVVQTPVRTACRPGAGPAAGSGWLLPCLPQPRQALARARRRSSPARRAASVEASRSCWSGVGTPWSPPTSTPTPSVVRQRRSGPPPASPTTCATRPATPPPRPRRRVTASCGCGSTTPASASTGRLTEVSSAHVDALVDVNLKGVLWGMRAALAAFGPDGGDVVNVASASALGPVPGLAVYAATKAAVLSATMSASIEAPAGVRVHALCPVGVDHRHGRRHAPGWSRAGAGAGRREAALGRGDRRGRGGLIGSRRVVRTLPAARGGLVRLGALAPSQAGVGMAGFERLGPPADAAGLAPATVRTNVRTVLVSFEHML